jgi:hypothetical protein
MYMYNYRLLFKNYLNYETFIQVTYIIFGYIELNVMNISQYNCIYVLTYY